MFAVIDVETTGGQVMEDRITEIAIFLTDGTKIIDSYTSLVNPEKKIMPFVANLTGITDEMVSTAPLFADIADKVEEMTKDAIFVAHNIGFDYSIIRKEFKRLNRAYKRSNLCTVKLSQKTIKDQPSYSLGNLCDNLGLTIGSRHRAYGDAEATVLLLHKIIKEQGLEYVEEFGNQQTHQIEFKGAITKQMIDELPEEPGLFRFMDKDSEVLYVKAAKNILAEVTKFLVNEIKKPNFNNLYNVISSIDTQIINSYVVAEIQEIEEIRQHKPIFNKSGIYKNYPVGVYENKNLDGPAFVVERNPVGTPIWRFLNERTANRFLKKMVHESNLHPPLVNDPNLLEDAQKEFKKRIESFLNYKVYPHRNCFIVQEVSFANTYYVISIFDYCYQGYAIIDSAFYDGSKEAILENIITGDNNPYIQKIIQRYLRKKKNYTIVPY